MNKSKGNMYKDITDTWNPLAGQCTVGCSYCSTNKLRRYPVIKKKYSGPLRLDKAINDNLGKGNFIFVVAQNDIFAPGIDIKIPIQIHTSMNLYPENRYLIQSKNTLMMKIFYESWSYLKDNIILCTTLETNRIPDIVYRAEQFRQIEHKHKHVTIEPIMDFDINEFLDIILNICPQQINIGADSGNNNLNEPSTMKVRSFIAHLKTYFKEEQIVLKDNLKRLL